MTDVALITLEEARLHLRVDAEPTDPVNQDIDAKILEASSIVIDYIKKPDHEWDDETAPALIKSAVKIVLANLFDNPMGDPLVEGVKNILHRYRDPALA